MREAMLVVHFLGLAMGLGTGLAFMFLGIAAGRMEVGKRAEFMRNAGILSVMGHIGLGLLIASGVYLIVPYWSTLGSMPLLVTKLILVLLLMVLIGVNTSLARKARQGNAAVLFARMATVGKVALLTSLTIVVVAVLVFQ